MYLQMNECIKHNENIVSKIMPYCSLQPLSHNLFLYHLHQFYSIIRHKAQKMQAIKNNSWKGLCEQLLKLCYFLDILF